MPTTKVGVREFRQRMTTLLQGQDPVAVTWHGETIGFYIPTKRKPVLESDLHALRTAAARLEGLLAGAGVEEEQVVEEFKQLRKQRTKSSAL
jgi:hypothetical protein